jgi:hypothetical protein
VAPARRRLDLGRDLRRQRRTGRGVRDRRRRLRCDGRLERRPDRRTRGCDRVRAVDGDGCVPRLTLRRRSRRRERRDRAPGDRKSPRGGEGRAVALLPAQRDRPAERGRACGKDGAASPGDAPSALRRGTRSDRDQRRKPGGVGPRGRRVDRIRRDRAGDPVHDHYRHRSDRRGRDRFVGRPLPRRRGKVARDPQVVVGVRARKDARGSDRRRRHVSRRTGPSNPSREVVSTGPVHAV